MEPEDIELVHRSQGGDLGAFNHIVERYQTQVFNLSIRMLGDRSSAEDVTQETFTSAYGAIRRFRGGSLRAWLLRIASNATRDLIRSSRRRLEQSLDRSMDNPRFQPRSRLESPEEYAMRGELAAEIQRAILSLPADQRTLLVLIDVQGLAYEEAAEAADISLGTVKSRLSRARAGVRDYLIQHGGELLPQQFRLG